ncbi:hypothetical protein [Lactobacillus kitasatonis]|uniref:Surface layer protein A domain-containing protein n=1 Tax=Lactobacillus kitasatonis TaxID=237446 RepID=A0ABS1LWW9_9LACO|nr:hypothetical protein [Lactobacillus kitasatonis]MBL1072763.1 hypothetical protein [Lactobacillus kitasatonis]
MNKKFISLALASILLAGGVALAPTSTVNAISKKAAVTLTYKNQKFRKVRLNRPVYVQKIHWKDPNYKSTVGPKIKLRKGKIVRIQQTGTDFGWYMHIPGHKGDYWIKVKDNDYSWFDLK